ncbi:cysteine hydrolase family protein [Paenibacillus taichungensis]|uniref:cysteine hydrolase family protein n=1 Tax=Paenibacillus taichungensis TaxID=484184 RepID=UPI002870BFB7|nr:cysteine hydrolase [Paenibacillus taichungensis]MDR9745715.1 cysteine hydrolase [Paenibacillus taichungensis]
MESHHNQAALLVMDMQNIIVSHYAKHEDALLPFQKAIEAARRHNVPVIFVKVGHRQDSPPISERNKLFGKKSSRGGENAANPAMKVAMDIHESVQPLPGELIVDKFRVSGFSESNLEIILQSHGINTLILSGIATSGVVLSTLCEAADKDYALTVLSDACLDRDPEVHRVLVESVFPQQADVLAVDDWINALM